MQEAVQSAFPAESWQACVLPRLLQGAQSSSRNDVSNLHQELIFVFYYLSKAH
jgi:hypothetical protein